METPRKYGVALDGATPGSLYVRIPVRKAGSADYATGSDWTPATGDVKVVKDAGAPANIATLPSYVNGSWQFTLSAAELTAKLVEVRVVDSATKAVDDAGFNVFTFGHASAFIPVDYSDGVRFGMTALPNAVAGSNGGLPLGDAAGRVTVGSIVANAINAAAIAADAITSGKIADNAFTAAKFAAGAFNAVWTVAARTLTAFGFGVTVTTNNDKTGYILADGSLTAAKAAADFIAALQSGMATQADILAITQAQRVRIVVPPFMERPDAGDGDEPYRIWIYAYNEQHQAEDLDAVPVVTVENNQAVNRSANLGVVTKLAGTTGIYYVDYTVAEAATLEGLIIKVDATEDGVTTQYSTASIVVDTTAVDFTASDRTKLNAVYAKLPSKTYLTGSNNADGDVQLDEATGGPVAANVTHFGGTAGSFSAGRPTSDINEDQMILGGTLGSLGWYLANTNFIVNTVSTNVLAIASKLAGITVLANWLRGLYRKDAMNATAKSEINSGGGTYDETTDSLQAIRDRGDAEWTTANTAGLATIAALATVAADVTSAKNVTTKMDTMLQNDAENPGKSQFTSPALKLTPSGTVNLTLEQIDELLLAARIVGADVYIDKATDPTCYHLVYKIKGTATEIARKELRDIDGAKINTDSKIPRQLLEVAAP